MLETHTGEIAAIIGSFLAGHLRNAATQAKAHSTLTSVSYLTIIVW